MAPEENPKRSDSRNDFEENGFAKESVEENSPPNKEFEEDESEGDSGEDCF